MSRGALPTRVGAGQRARLVAWLGGLALGALLLAAGATSAAGQMPVPPADGYVVDTTGQVSRAQREQLVALARQINASTGAQLFTVIVDRTDPEPIADFAQRVFEAWKPGRRGIDDGLLLVLAPNNETKKTRLQVGFGLEGAIPDAVARRILSEQVRPALDRDGPAAAARAAAATARCRAAAA